MMTKPKNEQGDQVWDEQICDYRQPQDFERQWEESECVICPGCKELKIKNDEDHKLIYCDNCGYVF